MINDKIHKCASCCYLGMVGWKHPEFLLVREPWEKPKHTNSQFRCLRHAPERDGWPVTELDNTCGDYEQKPAGLTDYWEKA